MSHLHRQLAAQAALQAQREAGEGSAASPVLPASSASPAASQAPAEKKTSKARGKKKAKRSKR
jgi:hypothetical protein